MSYYRALGLAKEPFSTSPDPDFFYPSSCHDTALKRLEIALRLRRGLSLILGDVGAGKTTLSRRLIQTFAHEEEFIFCMMMDPGYSSEFQFLLALTKRFNIYPRYRTSVDCKEELEKFLFSKGVNEQRTVVLIIDEGQKMSNQSLEALRVLLNYETNEYKLLQLVILAQTELEPRIRRMANFADRIALTYSIQPLDEVETGRMIDFRMHQAGYNRAVSLFSPEAVAAIYSHTHGHPRKIAMVCHDALEVLVMHEKNTVDESLIREVTHQCSQI